MSIVQDLTRSIKKVLIHNRDGSFATQYSREDMLLRFAKDLVKLGYGLANIQGLKQKHITAVVNYWQTSELAVSTIKNRTTALRYLCEKIKKSNMVPTNKQLNIGNRKYTPSKNRAIHQPDFTDISNNYIRVSLELERVFGLRREEALKIKPHLADKGNYLELLPSWCKGGRGRHVPVRTEEQRYWLDKAKTFAKEFNDSLIPKGKNYIQQVYVYDKQVTRAGLKNMHGLRHAFAQQRYKELTGWEAPLNGGPNARQLTLEQKKLDLQARALITEELGHSRTQITVNYLGR